MDCFLFLEGREFAQLQCSSCHLKLHYACGMEQHELQAKRRDEEQQDQDTLTAAETSADKSHLSNISHVSDAPGPYTEGIAGSQDPTASSSPPIHPVQQRSRVNTVSSAGGGFRDVVSQSELRRKKRCKGMLYGLKHMNNSVDTLLVLDSNGRSIKSEDIDGEGDKVCLRQIGGLCVSATTSALKNAARNTLK